MDELQIFSNDQFGAIRTTLRGGDPLFVAADVCKALDIVNSRDAIGRLDDDEKGVVLTDTLGGQQKMTAVTESGLYGLVLGSRKPEAKAFKRWITHEVIPTIRKHGAYMTPETLRAAIMNPDTMIQLCQQLKQEQEKNTALRIENSQLAVDKQIMAPKADYFDELVERNTLTNFRETAKQLEVPPKKFVQFLLDRKYIYRDKKGKLMPYEDKNKGLFEVKECVNDKTQWSGTQTLCTPKGRETFRLLCVGATSNS
jgi:prophage antirepressor-like protein